MKPALAASRSLHNQFSRLFAGSGSASEWRLIRLRARSATPVSKPVGFEIARFQNWEGEIGGGANVTVCHTSIYSHSTISNFLEHHAV